jgi:hypothetical protein
MPRSVRVDVERVLVDALEEAGPEDAMDLDRGVDCGGRHGVDPCSRFFWLGKQTMIGSFVFDAEPGIGMRYSF